MSKTYPNPAFAHAAQSFSRYSEDGTTTVRYTHNRGGRAVYCAEDPFPAPRPFERTSRSIKRTAAKCRRPRIGLIAMVAATAIAVFVLACVMALTATPYTADAGASSASTPKSAWKAGEVPYLYQTDPAWTNYEYAGSTVGTSGCGPTCLSMVYVALTGKTDRDPASMSAFSQFGGYVENGLTSWSLMTDGAARLGLTSREIPADAQTLIGELEAGHPVIASVGPGDFTSEGHFIVLAGIDESGKLVVHDPNSAERSAVTWDMNQVLAQCRGLWAYTR